MQLLRKEKSLQDVINPRIQHKRYKGLGKEERNQILPRKKTLPSWETENSSHLSPRAAQNLEGPPENEAVNK